MKKVCLATLFAAGVALGASADNNWFAASVSGLTDASWSAAPTVSDNAWQLAGNSPVLSLTKKLGETQTQMDATMSFEVTFDNAYLQSELEDVTVPQNAQGGILVAYDANNVGPYYYYRNGSAWTQLSNTAVSESALGTPVTVTVKITYSNLQTNATPTIAYEIGDIKSAVVTMASSPSGAVEAITCGGFGSVASLVGSTDVAVAKNGNVKVTAENLASVFTGSGTVELLANCTFGPGEDIEVSYLVKKNGHTFTFTKPGDGVKFENEDANMVTTYRYRKIDSENEWVKQNVPEGKTIQEVMDEKQTNGNKGFQNFALGLDKGVPLKVTAANKSGSNVTLASNAKDNGSGMAVAFKLFKGETEIADGTSLDVTTAAEGRYKIKAFVDGQAVDGTCANEIGLMRPASAKKSTIVAVPFKNIGTGDDIQVTDVVNPAVLSAGDTLQVFKGGKFETYVVNDNGAWQPVTTVDDSGSSPASGGTIARGSAVILTRTDTNKPIVLLGQCDGLEVKVKTSIGSDTSKPVWNLVASPSESAINPNTLLTKDTGADSICIPNDSGAPDIIEFNGTECGSYKTIVTNGKPVNKWVTASPIPAGTGFYYLGKGGRSIINW